MSFYRIAMILLIVFCVGLSFHRTWKHEQQVARLGVVVDKMPGRETVVWISPLYLPVLYLLIFILLLALDCLEALLPYVAELLVTLTLYFTLLLLLLPVLRRIISARACATLWVLPVFLYWLSGSWRSTNPDPLLLIPLPAGSESILIRLWALGFLAVFSWQVLSHFRFRHLVLEGAEEVANEDILTLWKEEQQLIERTRPIPLLYSDRVSSPMTIGLFARSIRTLLPRRSYTKEELELIFRHELRHVQRRDTDTKVFYAFCRAVCWFNPLMWVALRKAAEDLELSCDEMVLCGANESRRKQYAALLLDTAGDDRGFTTCLSASANALRHRLRDTVAEQKRLPGTLLLCAAMTLLMVSAGAVNVTFHRGSVQEVIFSRYPTMSVQRISLRSGPEHLLGGYTPYYGWDEAALLEYLGSLEVRLITGSDASDYDDPGQRELCVTFFLGDSYRWLDLTETTLCFYNEPAGEVYQLVGDVDWARVENCLDKTAVDPDPAPVRPVLNMWFNHAEIHHDGIPMTACDRVVTIHNADGLHTVPHQSVSWGGLHGISSAEVSHVELEFSYPPESYTVSVKGLDGQGAYRVKGEDITDGVLELADYSARYIVKGFFHSHRSTTYQMEFYFEVVYQEDMPPNHIIPPP